MERKPIKEKKRYHEEEYEVQKGEAPWAILFAIVTILAFVGGMFYFLYTTFFSQLISDYEDYTVPSIVGLQYADIMEDEALVGNFVIYVEYTVTDDSEAGTILRQSPTGNSMVRDPNSQITVTVSGGPEIIYMLDVTNQQYITAAVELRNMGLEIAYPVEYVFDDDVPSNYIISFSPDAGTPMSPGDPVSLVVSNGREEKQTDIISLEGMTQSWAETQIALMNLVVGRVTTEPSDTVAEGIVISQDPAPYTTVNEGTTVNLVVSAGPEVFDPNSDEITQMVTVDMPIDGATVYVQITMGGNTVYIGDVDTAMETSVSFPVTGTGTQSLSIYFDGILSRTETVEFGA